MVESAEEGWFCPFRSNSCLARHARGYCSILEGVSAISLSVAWTSNKRASRILDRREELLHHGLPSSILSTCFSWFNWRITSGSKRGLQTASRRAFSRFLVCDHFHTAGDCPKGSVPPLLLVSYASFGVSRSSSRRRTHLRAEASIKHCQVDRPSTSASCSLGIGLLRSE